MAVDKDEAEVFRLLSGAAAEEMGSGNRDSVCVVGFIEDAEGKRRRRIPFDFQRTSLVGLALDSATSSGLGRAPRSAMQDPIQAPPGTTRQAGLYTS
ncbi:hypothetical protein TNCV_3765381 [Trichonephila clavipes]|nr:hypothetical protein TNCV_3765381 [Trichonephila clavipes]